MEKYKKGISAFLPVYNEENRIAYILQSLIWCDEVIVLDKHSQDKTVEIARQFSNVKILFQENTEAYTATEFDIYLENCQYYYTLLATASDLIHPSLAFKMRNLIDDASFDYDVIEVPYKPYFLGICDKYSPWYTTYTNKIFKTSCLTVNEGEVHRALNIAATKSYRIEVEHTDEAYYHLTHQNADSIMERNLRYWRGERASSEPLSKTTIWVLKKTVRYFLINCVFIKGKAAIALAFSYLSYYMMSYVYRWDAKYSQADTIYEELREMINRSWNKSDLK